MGYTVKVEWKVVAFKAVAEPTVLFIHTSLPWKDSEVVMCSTDGRSDALTREDQHSSALLVLLGIVAKRNGGAVQTQQVNIS